MTQREFIETVRGIASDVYGVNPEAAAAHAANESAYGQSGLAKECRNLFGVKKGSSWTGPTVKLKTWEVVDGQRVEVYAEFRVYESWRHSVEDYADLAARLYPWAVQHRNHPLGWLTGLFLLGPRRWATDPAAYQKIVAILELHHLLDPASPQHKLGYHRVHVDNSPSIEKAWEQLVATLQRRPALMGPVMATRTQDESGLWKLDTRTAK